MQYNGTEISWMELKDGTVIDGDDLPPTEMELAEISQSPEDAETDEVQTDSVRSPDEVQTLSGRDTDVVQTDKTESRTWHATLARLKRMFNKDLVKEELKKYNDLHKELTQRNFVKAISRGLYTLETLPISGCKEMNTYFKERYGVDKSKTLQLVLATRIYNRVPKWKVCCIHVFWITVLALVVYNVTPKAKFQLSEAERNEDSVWVDNWTRKNKCQFWQMRYDYILSDEKFHNGSKAEREKILQAHKDTITGKFK